MFVPDDGDKAALQALLGPTGAFVTARLYANDFTPDRFSVVENFGEAYFSGYAPITSDQWQPPQVDSTGVAYMVSPALTWTCSAPTISNVVYGMYLTVIVGGQQRLIGAERFAVPIPMGTAGAQIARQLTYTARRAA